VEPAHTVSHVVALRCPVEAGRAALVLDLLVAPPAVLPVRRTGSSSAEPAARWSVCSPTWVGTADLVAGRFGRRRPAAVEVVPWSGRACEIQVRARSARGRAPSERWLAAAAALAADLAHLVRIAAALASERQAA
jgi:hypothetical protein